MKDYTIRKITTRKITTGMLFVIMVLSIFFSTGVFAANDVQTEAVKTAQEIGVEYRGHVENIGDMPQGEDNFIAGPEPIGTRGKSLRVEGFMIKLTGTVPEGAKIVYSVHVQNEGWMSAVDNGEFAGTRGESQRVESIKISLENLPGYDVYYRGHVQNIGNIPQVSGDWGWVKNGEELGTTGSSQRLEELEVKIVKHLDVSYDKAGTYGPRTGVQVVEDNVIINKTGVILQNMHIKGNLTIGEGVGEGDVTLNNVTVDGDTFIRGGGKNSIHINGGDYNKITVQQTSSGQTRIVAIGTDGLEVVISEDAKGEDIILEGAFENVKIDAPNVKVSTTGDTKIKEFDVAKGATGSQVTLDSKTTVDKLVLDEKTAVKGQGTVKEADVNKSGVTFEKAPVKQDVGTGVTPPVVTPPVTPPVVPPVVTPGGGGGGGSNTTPLSSLSAILGVTNVGMELSAGTIAPISATINFQWMICGTVDGTYQNIAGATSSKYTPVAGDATKFIKLKATGVGSYSGTVTSVATAVIQANPILTTTSTVANGAVNPTVVVTLTNDAFKAAGTSDIIANWTGSSGSTDLTGGTITRNSDTQITFQMTGTAKAGTLTLQAKAEALSSGVASNVITVVVSATDPTAGATTELAKIADVDVTTVPFGTTNDKTNVEVAMLTLANAKVDSANYTVTIAAGSTYDISTNVWSGKFTVTNKTISVNTKTDASARAITVIKNQAAADIEIPGVAGTAVTGVTVNKADGAVSITNTLSVIEGNVVGNAKTELAAQVPGVGGDVNKGYVGYTVNAPKNGALTKVVAYSDGNLIASGADVKDTAGSPSAKGSVYYYQAIAEKSGTDWKPFAFTDKTAKLIWYYADGSIEATTWTVKGTMNNAEQATNQLAADIDVPGSAGTTVTGVTVNIADGAVSITNVLPVIEGNVVGNAKTELVAQVPGVGGDVNKGYVGYTVNAPKNGALTKVVAYSDGNLIASGADVKDTAGSSSAKGSVYYYQAIAEKSGTDWKPFAFTDKIAKLIWYYADGSIEATTWTVKETMNNVEQSKNQVADDIEIPGLAGTTVTGVTVNKTDGAVSITNALELTDGKVTGTALSQLNAQTPGVGGDITKGYVGYTVNAPKNGTLTKVVAYSDGSLIASGADVKDTAGSSSAKGSVYYYQAIAEKFGTDWIKYDFADKTAKLVWYYEDGSVEATTWTIK